MPTNPLTPTEHAEVNAALETVKAEFDGYRLTQQTLMRQYAHLRRYSMQTENSTEYIKAYEMVDELLASQMAGRLAGVTR